MDAPEKIYLNAPKIQPELDNTTWDTKAWKDCENIEYIRKDALLEWAKEMQNSPLKNTTESADKHRLSKMIIDKISSL